MNESRIKTIATDMRVLTNIWDENGLKSGIKVAGNCLVGRNIITKGNIIVFNDVVYMLCKDDMADVYYVNSYECTYYYGYFKLPTMYDKINKAVDLIHKYRLMTREAILQPVDKSLRSRMRKYLVYECGYSKDRHLLKTEKEALYNTKLLGFLCRDIMNDRCDYYYKYNGKIKKIHTELLIETEDYITSVSLRPNAIKAELNYITFK